MWIVPINIPMTGVGYPMQWCYFRKWVDIAGKRSCQVPRVQWWRWSIVGCLSLPWGESIKTNWEPVRGMYHCIIVSTSTTNTTAQLRSPEEIIINILFSESDWETESFNRLCQAEAEISKGALQTSLAGGELRGCKRKSWQTKVASSETGLPGQQEYLIRGSDRSGHLKTNTATSDCQQWKTWCKKSSNHKQQFLPAAFGKNENKWLKP